jgi:hypothetical protein
MGADRKMDLEMFDFAIAIIALGLYVLERCIVFALLQNRISDASSWQTWIQGVLYGQPPYSILNVLLGFDLNQGLFGWVQPRYLLTVTIQVVHFLANYWIVRFPFLLMVKILKGTTGK